MEKQDNKLNNNGNRISKMKMMSVKMTKKQKADKRKG